MKNGDILVARKLAITDKAGNHRIVLEVRDDGAASIKINGGNTKEYAELMMAPASGRDIHPVPSLIMKYGNCFVGFGGMAWSGGGEKDGETVLNPEPALIFSNLQGSLSVAGNPEGFEIGISRAGVAGTAELSVRHDGTWAMRRIPGARKKKVVKETQRRKDG